MSNDRPTDSRYVGLGGSRRRYLDAIDEKTHLEPLDPAHTLDALIESIEDMSLGLGVMNPPQNPIDAIQKTHDSLPAEARKHYVTDLVLNKRINAARRQFNEWAGRKHRESEMPGMYEAGPSKYPTQKLRKRQRSVRRARKDLDVKFERITSGARGAKGRALNKIGSSVAEETERKNEETREERRTAYESGDLVKFRNPTLRLGEIVRVNQKSIRVRYPNPRAGGTKPFSDEIEPEFCEQRVDLDSEWLDRLTDEKIAGMDVEFDTVAEAREHHFGREE